MHRCPNRACPSRGLETLINWVQAAADIEGVGEQFVRRLWDEGLLRSMPDLYRLTAEQLLELDGYGEISARNAIEAIAASRSIPFRRILFGLNIPDVGWVTAQNLARHFGSVDRLIAATPEELVECEGIGPERAEAIAEWFARRGQPAADRGAARRSGSTSRPTRATGRKEGPLTGSQYVITGHARGLHARGGEGGARGARGEGLGQRLEEDDRRDRRREPGASKAAKAETAACRSSTEADLRELRRRLRRCELGEQRLGRRRPRPRARPSSRPGGRSRSRRTRSGGRRSPRGPRRCRSCPVLPRTSVWLRRVEQAVLERARLARRSASAFQTISPHRRVVPHLHEQRRELAAGDAVVAREPGAVGDLDAGRRGRPPRGGRASSTAAPAARRARCPSAL